jgi:hypothetical protein
MISRRPTLKQRQAACDAFNAAHPVGDSIWVAPGDVRGRFVEVSIVAPGAYVLSGHPPVVQVTGCHGCIALTHVRVRDPGGSLVPLAGIGGRR